MRVGGRTGSCILDAVRAMPGLECTRNGAPAMPAPRPSSLALTRPRPHDRGFAVRPSDDPPDDEPPDDDPLDDDPPDDDPPDDDPPDDDGVGDGWDVCLGRSRAVAPADEPPGCV